MQQLQKYLAMGTTSIDDDCMRFWTQNSSTLDKVVAHLRYELSVFLRPVLLLSVSSARAA